jgi:UDP-N-acetylmuramyl pentapeptide phosphotransferase/UDP-N-acetylglucosamine-1-phosphate transferase
VDLLVATTAGAYAFTLLVVAGTANAVNLIDGFNGLASRVRHQMQFLRGFSVAMSMKSTTWLRAEKLS